MYAIMVYEEKRQYMDRARFATYAEADAEARRMQEGGWIRVCRIVKVDH